MTGTGGRRVRPRARSAGRPAVLGAVLVLAGLAALVLLVVGITRGVVGPGPVPDAAASAAHHGAAESPAAGEPAAAEASPAGHAGMSGGDPSAEGAAYGAASDYTVLRDRLLGVLDRRGPARALRALDRAIDADPAVSGICHAVAHDLGHATLARFDGDAARALAVRNDVCGGGYTHGVVEMALGESRHIARDMASICAPAHDGSCYHGVGHGVMFAAGYDVPRALDLCDRAPSLVLSVRCGEGVFMQLFTLDDGASHMAGATYEQPTTKTAQRICERTRSPYDGNCWFYAPTVWLQTHPEDWAGVVRWCARADSRSGRETCTRGIGSRAVKYHPDDLQVGARVCASTRSDLRDDCLRGMGSYWSVHWKGQRAPSDVCGRLPSSRLESQCFAAVA